MNQAYRWPLCSMNERQGIYIGTKCSVYYPGGKLNGSVTREKSDIEDAWRRYSIKTTLNIAKYGATQADSSRAKAARSVRRQPAFMRSPFNWQPTAPFRPRLSNNR